MLGSLTAIWLYAGSASRENAAALHLEKSVMQLHILVRGLSDAVVTENSIPSRELVAASARKFKDLRALAAHEDVQLLAGWDGIEDSITRLMADKGNVAFDDDGLIAVGRISSEIEKIIAGSTARAEAQRAQARNAERLANIVTLGALALIVVGTFAFVLAFNRNVTRPVEAAIKVAGRVAEGDLSARAVSSGHGQAARLVDTMRDMSEKLGAIVTDVRGGTETIDEAALQLARSNEDLARRTERQATTLEETAASMEQLTTAVAENAASSKLASQKAAQARATAAQGGEVVGKFVEKMESIRDGSRRMSEIIGTIDGIAFQTNILALNAAVEAARAGEQGRGFAVVAAEVRSLAQRSGLAAKEIKSLIEASSEQVDDGGRMVESTRQIMQEIESSIDEASSLVQSISQASEQQASGIHQVNGAVAQMEQTVQENAALVESNSKAARALREQAGTLKQAVSIFKLDEDHAGAPALPQPAEPFAGKAPEAPILYRMSHRL